MPTICWGHDTGVAEDNTKDFSGNWSGSALIVQPGVADVERLHFDPGEDKISETWNIGFGRVKITLDKYLPGFGTPTVYYKSGDTQVNCEADTWHPYVGSFVTQGWVKIRIEAFSRLKLSTGVNDLILLDDGSSHIPL